LEKSQDEIWGEQMGVSCSPEQIEVGGPFVGIEIHHSSPLLNRVSFFYPVANSIDLSSDYWRRDQYRAMFLGLRIGNKHKEWIGLEPFECRLTPYSVAFRKRDDEKTVRVAYRFCRDKPAMVAEIEVTNNSMEWTSFEVYTHLELSLRTCHTYALKDKAWTEIDDAGGTIYASFDDRETGRAAIFVTNAGDRPIGSASDGEALGLPPSDESWWVGDASGLPGETLERTVMKRPVAAFIYRKRLGPREKMRIIHIIGSCQSDERRDMVSYLLGHYEEEIARYEEYVLDKAKRGRVMKTGDSALDHSIAWAKAILAVNAHYLDGEIVPMPCPAEYNFLFTHDVLVTDLAVVNFDSERVREDLTYIVRHANSEGVIPHAYYWKDERYVTEFAAPDDWVHLWFVLLCASYLRHSGDVKTLEAIYPCIAKSIEQVLVNKKDDLIWAHYPDWWDIGSSLGPRSYMTILAIRALIDFVYVSATLGKRVSELPLNEELASRMQRQLGERLWDENSNYLINYYEDGNMDKHIYTGSLLAAHFGLLEATKLTALVQTARKNLLDEEVGVRNVFPADFHTLTDYLQLKRSEVGEPFVYANGGIWPHGNAWYALALASIGEKAEALRFIKRTMTLEGIMNSPNGQPAMYEYRNGNKQDPSAYGKVDKPQFLWAAGWYLYCLYRLFGARENEWNLSFDPYLPEGQRMSEYSLLAGGRDMTVTVRGSGRYIKSLRYGGEIYPSAVIPEKPPLSDEIEIVLGAPELPYVADTSAALLSSRFDNTERSLVLELRAFGGHYNETTVISPWEPRAVSVNGAQLRRGWGSRRNEDTYETRIGFVHESASVVVIVQF
jgi:cellobiose phosphorylase